MNWFFQIFGSKFWANISFFTFYASSYHIKAFFNAWAAYVFILQQHPLFPDELENCDEAGGDHSPQEHDEHASEVGETKLTALLGTAALEEGERDKEKRNGGKI